MGAVLQQVRRRRNLERVGIAAAVAAAGGVRYLVAWGAGFGNKAGGAVLCGAVRWSTATTANQPKGMEG